MSFKIENNRLVGARFVPAPESNIGGRIEPTLIIIHTTDGHIRKGGTTEYFLSDECIGKKTSCHFVVEYDGAIIQMVDTDVKANHCGESTWEGRRYVNGFADGIEVVNPGQVTAPDANGMCFHMDDTRRRTPYARDKYNIRQDSHGKWWMPFSAAQTAAIKNICAALIEEHKTIKDIRGHFDISPGRKTDPGPLAPMDELREFAFGAATPSVPVTSEEVKEFQSRLVELGYNLGIPDGFGGPKTRKELRYFQEQNGLPITGEFDNQTVDVLMSENAKSAIVGSRDEWTKKDVKDQGSTQMASAENVRRAGLATKALGTGLVVTEVVEKTVSKVDVDSVLDTAERGVNVASRLNFDLSSIGNALSSPLVLGGMFIILFGGFVFWQGMKMIEARLLAAQRGQDTSKIAKE